MNNKLFLTSTFTLSLLLSGCSNDINATYTTSEQAISNIKPSDSDSLLDSNPLYNTYLQLSESISSNNLKSPEDILNFLSNSLLKNGDITFQDNRNENGDIYELVFSTFTNSLTIFFTDNQVTKLRLDFEESTKSISNSLSKDTSYHSLSRHFNTSMPQAQYINKKNSTNGESKYLDIIKALHKSESIKLNDLESKFDFDSKSTSLLDDPTPTSAAVYSHTYNLDKASNESISILSTNDMILSVTYTSNTLDQEHYSSYITHSYFTELQRKKSSLDNTPKAITNSIHSSIDEQINEAPILFEYTNSNL